MDKNAKSPIGKWLNIARYWSFQVDFVAVSVGAAFVAGSATPQSIILYLVLLAGAFSMNAFGNIANDIFDFRHKVDSKEDAAVTKRGHPLVTGSADEKKLILVSIMLLIMALACGIYLATVRGAVIILLGIVGAIGAFFYTAGKHNLKRYGMGELLMFIIFGPMMVCASCYIETGSFLYSSLPASFVVGIAVALIMLSNNIRDIKPDIKAGMKTMAVRLGIDKARVLFKVFIFLIYALVAASVMISAVPVTALIVFLSLPYAISMYRETAGAKEIPYNAAAITTSFYMLFGVLLAIGIAI